MWVGKGWEFSEVERQDGIPSPVFASSCHSQQKSSETDKARLRRKLCYMVQVHAEEVSIGFPRRAVLLRITGQHLTGKLEQSEELSAKGWERQGIPRVSWDFPGIVTPPLSCLRYARA